MILDHETDEEKIEARATAEQQLDRIYHAIPQWVNCAYPQHTLAERIAVGFAEQQKKWEELYRQEVLARDKMNAFVVHLTKKHGLNFMDEYWNFLVSKDLETAKTEKEKKMLTKMRKPV